MDFFQILFSFCLMFYSLAADLKEEKKYAANEDFPFLVLVEVDRKPVCGGAIIGDKWVVTARQCLPEDLTAVNNVKIRAGTKVLGSGGAFHYVSKLVKFDIRASVFTKDDADVGLIKVKSAFFYSPRIQWSSPAVDSLAEGRELVVAGWGINDKSQATILQQASVKVISNEKCQEIFQDKLNITRIMSCLVPLTPDDNACIADVGSPVSASGLITAVVSNNQYCKEDNKYPVVVTNIGDLGFFIVITLAEPYIRFNL